MPKLVDTPHYHLWTDALHLRALAHQAKNNWDRGTYVRGALIVAWTTLELACDDALDATGIGRRFKENLREEIQQKGLPALDWSQGVWQEVSALQRTRVEFVHHGISNQNQFAPAEQADKAIDVCRRAIKAIYVHASKTPPQWVDDNSDSGFQAFRQGLSMQVMLQIHEAGADPNGPDTVRIGYVDKDGERIVRYSPPGTNHVPLLDELAQNVRIPILAVRAYRGSQLLEERRLNMRGN